VSDVETTVRALIAAAGLAPDEEEVRAVVEAYPALRASLDRLHEAPIDRQEEPQTLFRSTP
jgi:hypothetical protein